MVSKDELTNVNVKVEGSRSDLAYLSAEDLVASVDLGIPKEGIKTLIIKVEAPSGIKVDSVSPSNVNIKIEKIVKKDLPVDVKISDRLKDSKIIKVSEQSPENITVSGLRNHIDKLDKLMLKIDDEEYLDGKIHNVAVKPVDKNGKIIENLELSQKYVSISFDVLQSKEVNVEVNYDDIPKNMKIEESKISPVKVIIKGEKNILDKIDSIKTKKIDLSNLKDNEFEQKVELEVPEDVELNNPDFFVDVYVKLGKKN